MLVLERKEDEHFIITTPEGETLEIHLLTAKGGRAKLGIIAERFNQCVALTG